MKMKILLENFKKYLNEEQQELTEFLGAPNQCMYPYSPICGWIDQMKIDMGSKWTEKDQMVVMGPEYPSGEYHPDDHFAPEPFAVDYADGDPAKLLKHPYYIKRGFDKYLAPLINKWAEDEGVKAAVGKEQAPLPHESARLSDEDLKKVVGGFLRKQKRSPEEIEQILNNADTKQLQNMFLKFKNIQRGYGSDWQKEQI